jgi:glutathione synthase/RimK-type ligase-like ATP-grasp enzyme
MINALFSYSQHSDGAKGLKNALGVPKIKHTGSTFVPAAHKKLINWGATPDRFPQKLLTCQVINHPDKVALAVDKMTTFKIFRDNGVSCPEFTTERATAVQWLEQGHDVFARTQLRASSGRGIVIMDHEHPDTWEVGAPLYVKYVKKQDEYRIHVVRGQVIDVQRKGLRAEFQNDPNVNWKIRNLANGFVFSRDLNTNRPVPQIVKDVGIAAVQALGLDFGAADVIYQRQSNRAYALEVNTAPGLEGQTVTSYATALSAL